MTAQIALPLDMPGRDTPSRIVVGAANLTVIEACQQADSWPFRTAILFGPARSGKSLLARWFAESGVGEAVDDADRMDETALFHRWNRAQESGTPLLLTATTPPDGRAWEVSLPDLGTRLRAALRLDIGEPDDIMLEELIALHAEARALPLSPEGCHYLASRAERSHLNAETLVAIIDRLSLERKAAPGMSIWREALEEVSGSAGAA
jgi:chromosomal replication initiation ATPase DnaA